MTADLLTVMEGGIAQVFGFFELSTLYLIELKARNWSWFLIFVMLIYVCIYAALIGPSYRFFRRFNRNIMALPVHTLLILNMLLPIVLIPLALFGPEFWLPAGLFILLYMLLLGAEGKNAQNDGAVIYLVHSQFLIFIILPTAFILRLVSEVYRWFISVS